MLMFFLYADTHWLSIIYKKQYIGVKKNINWISYNHQSEFLSQAIEQTSASIFQYVKYIFKSLSPAIIRIRNVVDYLHPTIVGHPAYFPFRFHIRSFFLQGINIAVIHTQNQIELIKIISTDRT